MRYVKGVSMQKKVLFLILITFLLVMPIASAYPLTIKYTTASSPIGAKALWQIGFIQIYEYDKLSIEEINKLLEHEYQHELCWQLFKIYPKDIYDHSPRCFT